MTRTGKVTLAVNLALIAATQAPGWFGHAWPRGVRLALLAVVLAWFATALAIYLHKRNRAGDHA